MIFMPCRLHVSLEELCQDEVLVGLMQVRGGETEK
jgi:hypothetical protein